MKPSDFTWGIGLAAHLTLFILLIVAGPIAWLPAAALLLPLPWLIRRSRYAHQVNCLLVLMYAGGGLVFVDTGLGLAVACVAALDFLCSVYFVRLASRGH